ncbi:endoribonuclease CG2145-like [Sitodiplosis mosellana]|uniref:endoribonuclease CG2145-like n=1 Tax=Sitodiplosis mosellana TaxID=263140 RepID=UPI002443AF76|nr:endoribonuclease CG2145-like [Sitodiplosis mosellana]
MKSFLIAVALIVVSHCQTTLCREYESSESEFEELTEKLFRESAPNIFPYVKVNLQSSTSSWSRSDDAEQPLLNVDESVVYKVPTIAKLVALFDNYELDASDSEEVTPEEQIEEMEFIDAVLDTQVMQTAMNFLHKKGYIRSSRDAQFDLLRDIWFGMYPRTRGNIGSSGFEHVFLNEMKYGSPIGLHNWIYFHHKENVTGNVDYKGYMDSLLLGNKGQIVKYRFSFDGVTKPVNSMFIGTLPELDMALFTVCFEMNKTYCQISLDGNKLTIRTFPFNYHGKRMVGATYPVI